MIGITRNMWRKQNGLYSGMNFPINGLQFYLPMWHPEQQGYALSYDGNDLLSNATANWRNGDTEGTFEQIFRSSSVANNQTLFASADTGTATSFLWVYVAQTTGKVTISTQNAAGTVNTVAGGTNICDGKDKHIVVTTDGSTWAIDINGVAESLSVGAGSNTGDWLGDITLRDNLTIGAITRTSTANYAIGVDGYTRVYSRVMAVAEARTNYQRGRFAAASDATGLVFNLPLTEGTGNPVDTVGALTMTIIGATWIESLMDKSPNALACSAFGIPTWGVTGRDFDGNDQYINCGNDVSFNITQAITLEAWVQQDTSQATCRILSKYNPNAYFLSTNTRVPRLEIEDTGVTTHSMLFDTTLTLGTWYHLVGTYDGANMRGYTNGAVDATPTTAAFTIRTSTSNLCIGILSNATAIQEWYGEIGEVRIYDRALTPAEITANYNATKWRYL